MNGTEPRKLSVLINAYAVSPSWGSEPGVGWNWIINLAQTCDVYVITESEWQDEIEKAVAKLPQKDNIHFYFNPVPQKVRDMCWNQGDWRFYWHYRKWQKRTLILAKDIINNNAIDVIHQLNMIGFREPGYLWKINDIPFVWGPIGNMSSLPIEHVGDCSRMVKAKAYLKNIISSYQRSHGRVKKALLRADYIFTALDDTQHIITKNFQVPHIETMPEAGIYSHGEYEHEFHKSEGLRLLWVGRFIPTKKLDIALKVLSKLPKNISLDIVGWGNEQEEIFYKKYAEELGVGERVKWHGKLPNADVQQLMRENDVFLFTSVVEGTPHVVLEAVSNNLPVVCFDLCGQGVIVNDEVGIKMPFTDNNAAIEAMVQKISEINCNREYLAKFSLGCKTRKTALSWESKINHVIKIYHNLKYGSSAE